MREASVHGINRDATYRGGQQLEEITGRNWRIKNGGSLLDSSAGNGFAECYFREAAGNANMGVPLRRPVASYRASGLARLSWKNPA
jgi:hypothetical protein